VTTPTTHASPTTPRTGPVARNGQHRQDVIDEVFEMHSIRDRQASLNRTAPVTVGDETDRKRGQAARARLQARRAERRKRLADRGISGGWMLDNVDELEIDGW